jgi:ABC-type Mn2+/Zn2+ transport system ATPase subunit
VANPNYFILDEFGEIDVITSIEIFSALHVLATNGDLIAASTREKKNVNRWVKNVRRGRITSALAQRVIEYAKVVKKLKGRK